MIDIRENVCRDWFSCTFSYIPDHTEQHQYYDFNSGKTRYRYTLLNSRVQRLLEILNYEFEDISKEDHSINGFQEMITIGQYINLALGGPKNKDGYKTVQLKMSGDACREFELRKNNEWFKLFNEIDEFEVNPTRIDIAWDLFHEDYFTIDEVIDVIRKFYFVCTAKDVEYQEKVSRNGTVKKKQCYMGSLRSDLVINVYDKNAEQRFKKKKETWKDTWMRIEVRFTGERAKTMFELMKHVEETEFAEWSASVLKSVLDLKTSTGSHNLSKRRTWHKWNKFLDNAEKIDIQNQAKLEVSLIKKIDWVDESAGMNLLLMYFASELVNKEEDFDSRLRVFMANKMEKLKSKHVFLINEYLRIHGADEINMDDLRELFMNLFVEKEIKTGEE